MEKIKWKDIDFSTLRKLQSQGTNSTIYTDGLKCYKLLDGLYPEEKRELYRKFLDMDGIEIEGVLLPQEFIMEEDSLKGYTMQYFENSMPLSDKFLKRFFNCQELLFYVYQASKILRRIHAKEIVCQDLSFENILVDKDGNVVFCDIDGCSYKEHRSPFYSLVFKKFWIDYRKSNLSEIEDLDVDKLSMILSLYLEIYGEVLENITKKQYRALSKNIQTLENLKEIVKQICKKNASIRNLPYLDEVIDLQDDYEVDREKILTMRKRILRRK